MKSRLFKKGANKIARLRVLKAKVYSQKQRGHCFIRNDYIMWFPWQIGKGSSHFLWCFYFFSCKQKMKKGYESRQVAVRRRYENSSSLQSLISKPFVLTTPTNNLPRHTTLSYLLWISGRNFILIALVEVPPILLWKRWIFRKITNFRLFSNQNKNEVRETNCLLW